VESTDRTQRSGSNSNQHEDSDILTISDSSEDEEWGEMDASGGTFFRNEQNSSIILIAIIAWE